MQPLVDAAPPLLDDRHLVVSTTDPERAHAQVRRIYTEADWVFGRHRGPLSPIRLRNASFGAFGLSTITYGREVSIRPRSEPGVLMVVAVVRGSVRFARGARSLDAGPGTVVVVPASEGQVIEYGAESETCKFTFGSGRVEALCARLAERRTSGIEFDLGPASRPQFLQWMAHARMLATLARDAPGAGEGLSGSIEEMLMTALLTGHAHSGSDALRRPAGRLSPTHIRRAVAWVAEHLGEAITLEGLADAAGCSARSLHRGFREALDVTPMRYVRETRLRRVREALLDAGRRAETITELAMAHGFSHLGEFAAHYRLLFGERPQQTRRAS